MLRSNILKIKYLILLTPTNTTLNAKINEIKNKILSVNDLAITSDLTAIESKIPNVSV